MQLKDLCILMSLPGMGVCTAHFHNLRGGRTRQDNTSEIVDEPAARCSLAPELFGNRGADLL
jgi:hypothetical protein